jgi:hypothetical protein
MFYFALSYFTVTTGQKSTSQLSGEASNVGTTFPPEKHVSAGGSTEDNTENNAPPLKEVQTLARRSVSAGTVARSHSSQSENNLQSRDSRSTAPLSRTSTLVCFSYRPYNTVCHSNIFQNIERAPALEFFDLDRDFLSSSVQKPQSSHKQDIHSSSNHQPQETTRSSVSRQETQNEPLSSRSVPPSSDITTPS